MDKEKKLTKSPTDCKIFGVCGGLAEYLDIESSFIRLIFVIICIADPLFILGYFIAAAVIPNLPPAERYQRIHKHMFGEIWEDDK